MAEKHEPYENQRVEFQIFSTLRKIIKAVDIYSSRLRKDFGISSSQLSCLLSISEAEPISQSDLSKKVSLSPSMITSVIDQLEKSEMVKRTRNTTDRRIIHLELTDKGRETVRNAPLSFQKYLVDGLRALKGEDKSGISDSLSKLLTVISTEILIDSTLLGADDKLAGVEPSVLKAEAELKDEDDNKKEGN